jgi:hypothetical protein
MSEREVIRALRLDVQTMCEREVLLRHIICELCRAIERFEVPPDLLSIIGSWGDTLDDSEILELLKGWNETGKVLHSKA